MAFGTGTATREPASTPTHPSTSSSTKSYGKISRSRSDTPAGRNYVGILTTSKRSGTYGIIPHSTSTSTALPLTRVVSNGLLNAPMDQNSTQDGFYPVLDLPASAIRLPFKVWGTSRAISITQLYGLSTVSVLRASESLKSAQERQVSKSFNQLGPW